MLKNHQHSRRPRRPHHRISVFSAILLVLAVVIALFPTVWVILSSFKSNQQILSSGIGLPTQINFDGYRQALSLSPLLRFFGNSLLIAAVATVANVFFVSLAAYVFARCQFRGKTVLYDTLMISMMIPMTALLSPLFSMISALHLYDKRLGLILVYTGINLAMSLMIMRSAYAAIPIGIEDAARVDGAGFFRVYWQIMTPIAKGGVASAAVLAFLNNWNEFTFALTLTGSPSVRTLPLALSYFTTQFSFNYTAMFAAITLSILPSILIFALFQEQIIHSMSAGAVKG